jgi:hypothetical protein
LERSDRPFPLYRKDANEIKFVKHTVGMKVIEEGISCRPVLIHVNGISEDVLDNDYFSSIIDISKLLE